MDGRIDRQTDTQVLLLDDDERIKIILNNECWAGVMLGHVLEGTPDSVLVFHFAD